MRARVAGVLGLLSLLGAVAVLALPAVGASVTAALAGFSPGVVVALLAALAVLAVVARVGATPARAPAHARVRPERDPPDRAPVLGASVEDALARATAADATRDRRAAGRDRVRALLREGATEAVAAAEGVEHEAAREAVLCGEWTDDPRAAAVVGDERAPSPPWRSWIWDLLRGEDAFRRRVRHATAEIREVAS